MTKNSKFLEGLALRVASGISIASAAVQIGCSKSHAYTLSASPEFRRRVSEIRAAMTDQAVGELSAGAAEAVAVLRQLLKPDYEPPVRLQAATKLLALLGPISESNEIRQRLALLEHGTDTLRIAR